MMYHKQNALLQKMIRENVRLAQKFEAFVRSDNRWEIENLASIQEIFTHQEIQEILA